MLLHLATLTVLIAGLCFRRIASLAIDSHHDISANDSQISKLPDPHADGPGSILALPQPINALSTNETLPGPTANNRTNLTSSQLGVQPQVVCNHAPAMDPASCFNAWLKMPDDNTERAFLTRGQKKKAQDPLIVLVSLLPHFGNMQRTDFNAEATSRLSLCWTTATISTFLNFSFCHSLTFESSRSLPYQWMSDDGRCIIVCASVRLAYLRANHSSSAWVYGSKKLSRMIFPLST